MSDRYDTSNSIEAQYQPGTNDTVLLNKLDITNSDEMDEIELGLLNELTSVLMDEIGVDQTISTADLREWHRRWLGNVFTWAGEYRSVNMAKDGFQFASAHLIPGLMNDFENMFLNKYTSCSGMSEEELIEALAVVHIEYILVHPFRVGNGRLSRLLATIMTLQCGQPILDFSYMDENKIAYFAAIQTGLVDDGAMKEIFRQVLLESQRNVGD